MNINNMRLLSSSSKLKAFFDLELDNGIVIKGMKIAEGPSGLFVAVPSEKDKDGKYWDRVFIPRDLKEQVADKAIASYDAMNAGGTPAPATTETPDLPF